jgi:hypothetical protein
VRFVRIAFISAGPVNVMTSSCIRACLMMTVGGGISLHGPAPVYLTCLSFSPLRVWGFDHEVLPSAWVPRVGSVRALRETSAGVRESPRDG